MPEHPVVRRAAAVAGTSLELAKATILNTSHRRELPVMYNPEELKLEQGNTFAEVGIPGLDTPPVQYVRGKARALSMELFFDTYEKRRGRAHAHRARWSRCSTRTRANWPAGAAVLPRPAPVPVRAGRRRPAVHDVPRATAPRCGPRCRSASRSTCALDVEIRRGLFFGSPTVSAAVERGRRCGRSASPAHGARHERGRDAQRARRRLPRRSRAVAAHRRRRTTSSTRSTSVWAARWSSRPAARGARRPPEDAVTEPFYAPRFEVLLSGVTMAADLTEQVVGLTVETDLDMAGTFSLVAPQPR